MIGRREGYIEASTDCWAMKDLLNTKRADSPAQNI